MSKRKKRVEHAEIVRLFAARLRELRYSRGMTQADLARAAHITTSYVGRLEAGGAAPGIDLVDRLATALGTKVNEMLPTTATPDTQAALRVEARRLFEALVHAADKDTLLMLCPLLARLVESTNRMK
jgi:transcriptional regulator with XRE-family HTH domain